MSDLSEILSGSPKQMARGFGRWLDDNRVSMTPELLALAERALLTLKSLDQPAAEQSQAFIDASMQDLRAFADAWALRKR